MVHNIIYRADDIERLNRLAIEFAEQTKRYRDSLDADEMFEVRKRILLNIRSIERAIAQIQKSYRTVECS